MGAKNKVVDFTGYYGGADEISCHIGGFLLFATPSLNAMRACVKRNMRRDTVRRDVAAVAGERIDKPKFPALPVTLPALQGYAKSRISGLVEC